MKSRELLYSFTKFCQENPELRFWQALRAWVGWNFIYVSKTRLEDMKDSVDDTYYWEENK